MTRKPSDRTRSRRRSTRLGPLALLVPMLLGAGWPAAAVTGDWRWPVGEPVVVLRGFEPPAGPYGPGHRGVDLAVREGGTVRASGGGIVLVAGAVAGRPVVVVGHGSVRTSDELRTTYEPVRPSVVVGQRVAAGDPLGQLGDGPWHCSTSCVHWGLRRGPTYLDPTGLLDRAVRLLPAGPPVPLRNAPVPRTAAELRPPTDAAGTPRPTEPLRERRDHQAALALAGTTAVAAAALGGRSLRESVAVRRRRSATSPHRPSGPNESARIAP